MASSKSIVSPNDVEISNVVISNTAGLSTDITDLVVEINIYEEMGQPILLAEMMLIDGTGLLSNFPLTGQELITANIQRGDVIQEINMRTSKVVNVDRYNDLTMFYTLELVEEAYFYNILQLVSQAYEGTIDEIINSIMEDYLHTELRYVEKSSGTYKCVIPNWNPYKAINWLMGRAIDESNVPIVLYNTWRNGTAFTSFNTLFKGDPKETFKYHSQNKDGEQQNDNFKQIAATPTNFDIINNGIIINQIQSGAFGSTYMNVDTSKKFATEFEYNIEDYYDDQPRLQNNLILNKKNTFDGKKINEYKDTIKSVNFTSGGNFGEAHSNYNTSTNSILPFSNNYNRMLSSFKYEIQVPGRFDIEVGSIVELEFTKTQLHDKKQPEEVIDKKRSGKHLVTKCRHMIKATGDYQLVLEVVSDGLGEDYNAK